jgi:hypothetical protein
LSLYYLRARYYNPLTGRFLSRDPKPGHIGIPHTQHKYLYASADPVDRIDPFGKSDLVEDEDAQAAPEAAEPGERQLASRINCILETSAGALNALSTIESGDILGSGFAAVSLVENWETCSGEATGKGGGKGGEGGEGGGKGGGNCCFAAGTPVHTNHGDVPVEKVVVGDEVVSRNRTNGKLESQHVTALTPPHKDNLVEVRVEGERTPLRPSLGHPFWVKRGDAVDGVWMEAGTMRVGDLLQNMQGDWRRVVSITPVEGQETVYNFTVAKDHDYFVGETGFLVHNQNCPCGRRTPEENRKARNTFKNNKPQARSNWEQRTGNQWPTDENDMPWPAEHDPPLKEGGDPMNVYPRDPGAPDPHNIPGPNGLTDYQIWGALGTAARLANQLCDLEE